MSNAEPNCKEQYCSGVGNCCCVTYGQFKYLMSYYKTGKVDHMGIENLETWQDWLKTILCCPLKTPVLLICCPTVTFCPRMCNDCCGTGQRDREIGQQIYRENEDERDAYEEL